MRVIQIRSRSPDMRNRRWQRKARHVSMPLKLVANRNRKAAASAALLCTLPLLAVPAVALEAEHHWSYSGASGPSHWSSLEPDYRLCRLGHTQSPIDIATARVKAGNLPALAFGYV